MYLVPILIQPVLREDNEKSRNGRGKSRSENSRKDTEQFEVCRRYNITGRKNADMTKLIRRLKRERDMSGLYFNLKKTKIMTTADWESFEIGREEIEVVTSFTFLGSEVEKEGMCDKEIKRRVTIEKATMIGPEKLQRGKHVSIDMKKRIVRSLIFLTILYGCETWTMTKKMEKRSMRVRCGYGERCKKYH